ncbi:MAG: hypothetical protein MI757_02815 [Pirellulales bacterium]|nr:hypothetical protein [Pirellulales bacterium]
MSADSEIYQPALLSPIYTDVAIVDDEQGVWIEVDTHEVDEAGGEAVFTVSRSGATDQDLIVDLELTGTAAPNLDFNFTNAVFTYDPLDDIYKAELTIPEGESSVEFTLKSIDDAEDEFDEFAAVDVVFGSLYLPIFGLTTAVVGVKDSTMTIDVDVDSDNTGRFEGPATVAADREAEDEIEGRFGLPGKYVETNHADEDGDGIPDFRDGFQVGSITRFADDASHRFIPMEVTIPTTVDVTKAKIKFVYDQSKPEFADNATVPGSIRIWTKDGDVGRRGWGVDEEFPPIPPVLPGDFVHGDDFIDAEALGFDATTRTVTFYIEGVNSTPDAQILEVILMPDSTKPGETTSDRVYYTAYRYAAKGNITISAGALDSSPVREAQVQVVDNAGPLAATILATTNTDEGGNYFIVLPDGDGSGYDDLEIRVFASNIVEEIRPGGFAPGQGIVVGHGDFYQVTVAEDKSVSNSSPVLTEDETITAFDDPGKAFFVYDAAVDAQRFEKTLDFSHSVRYSIRFPTPVDLTGAPPLLPIYIAASRYNADDVVRHEWGHKVQQANGFFPYTNSVTHVIGINNRSWHPSETRENILQPGFSEGFANFFSMAAEYHATKTVPSYTINQLTGAALNIETHTLGTGEDEEMSVARVLWDLYDGTSTTEPDRVELGKELFEIIDEHDVLTLDELWKALQSEAADDHGGDTTAAYRQQMIDYGAVFQHNGISAKSLTMNGFAGLNNDEWSKTSGGDPGATVPTFEFTVPTGNAALTLSNGVTIEDAGQLLNRFGIAIFNDTLGTVVYHTLDDVESDMDKALSVAPPGGSNGFEFVGETDVVRWTPDPALWNSIITDNPTGDYHWIIYAGDFGNGFGTSGPYWSDLKTFKITM